MLHVRPVHPVKINRIQAVDVFQRCCCYGVWSDSKICTKCAQRCGYI